MDNAALEQLRAWMDEREDEHLELKEAKSNYHFEKLVKYCSALANEGGGTIILGVTDRKPRRVVGTQAFAALPRTQAGLLEQLRLRVDAEEITHPDGRVLAFRVPSRPIGVPLAVDGAYWMRTGEDLVPMSPDQLKRIFDEGEPDFSATTCAGATLDDLDPAGIETYRELWMRKSGNPALAALSPEQLLADAELMVDGRLTYAALILFGTRRSLGKHLAQSEVVFEYRSTEASGPAAQRLEYRQGLMLTLDALWQVVNLRNDKQHFQHGLFVLDVSMFNERSCREVVLNALVHRDYRSIDSVFVRQYPRRLEVVSPGGFPTGITEHNILWKQSPRNRRVAEAIGKTPLVERAGQGMNLIYENCIRESKPMPDFTGTDGYHVWVTLHGEIQDERFLRFVEKIGAERLMSFDTRHFLALDLIHREQRIPQDLHPTVRSLLEQGIVELAGDGNVMLSRALYTFLGKKGVYTRKRGLNRETNKELLLKHIADNGRDGSKLEELLQVLPALSRRQVQNLLSELREENKIFLSGSTKAALWYRQPESD